MQKQIRQKRTEDGYSKFIPEHQYNDYVKLIDALSVRVDSLNFAAMEFSYIENFTNFLIYELSTDGLPQSIESIATKNDGKTWKILKDIYPSSNHGDLLLCSREDADKREFAVIAKLKPNSPDAEIYGGARAHVIGDDASHVLERFLHSERRWLLSLKEDYERTIALNLLDKFIDDDCKEVFSDIERERVNEKIIVDQAAGLLKRNGEYCKHKVPGFPGLLTATEYDAYVDTLASVERELEWFKKLEACSPAIERIVPHWKKLAARLAEKDPPKSIRAIMRLADEKTWQIYEIFSKPERECETLFCSREEKGKREFAVIERIDLKGSMIYFGEGQIHALGKDASVVLEEFFRRERASLHYSRKELEYVIEKKLSEKLPPEQHDRVFKAIAPIYDKEKFVTDENIPTEKISNVMKIKH